MPGSKGKNGRAIRYPLFGLGVLALLWAVSPLVRGRAKGWRDLDKAEETSDLVRKRADWFFHPRAYPLGHVPAAAKLNAWREAQKIPAVGRDLVHLASGAPADQWIFSGPQPTIQDSNFGMTSGRVSSVAIDTSDSTWNTVYITGAAGGVWRTTDGGNSWFPLTDAQPSLASGSLALDTTTSPTSIYFGTGEENFAGDNLYGAGVLRSDDGGAVWTEDISFVIPGGGSASASGPYIGSLSIQPGHNNVLLAGIEGVSTAVHSGIYRSSDSGNSWARVFPVDPNFDVATSVQFDGNDSTGQTAFAALGRITGDPLNGVYKSTDGGNTWTMLSLPATQTKLGRITLALGPQISGKTELFAAIADGTTTSTLFLGLFKSVDGGATWTQLTFAPAVCNAQCFYDMALAVNPANSSMVFFGGAAVNGTLYRSTDSGASWTEVSASTDGTFIHVDVHSIVISPDGTKLYIGNDGGMWSSTNVTNASTGASSVTWTNLNSPLGITQFYPGMSFQPGSTTAGLGGTQDNGTQYYAGSVQWQQVNICGDGGSTAFDFQIISNAYVTCEDVSNPSFLVVAKSTAGGLPNSFNSAQSGITLTDVADFIPPLVIDPTNSKNIYFGTFRLYQTTNSAGSWTPISGDLTLVGSGMGAYITTMAVAPNDSNTVYAGTIDGNIAITSNVLSGSGSTYSFANYTLANLPPRSVTSVAIDPTTKTTAYATFSGFSGFVIGNVLDTLGHVFQTTNGGSTWVDISGNLPNIPVNDIVIDAQSPSNTFYVATDLGVYSTTNAGATWSALGTGLPNTEVLSLVLNNSTRLLRAGTHGRSVWDLALVVQGVSVSISPASVSYGDVTPGTTSPPMSITLTSNGSDTLDISGVSLSGANSADFAITADTCTGASLPTNATCAISATFTPSISGSESASLNITDNAPNSPQMVVLSGTGSADFGIGTPNPASATVTAGGSAVYSIPTSTVNGISTMVLFSCGGLPANSTCSFSPNPVDSGATTTLTIGTTANTLAPPGTGTPGAPVAPRVISMLTIALAALLGCVILAARRRNFRVTFTLTGLMVFFAFGMMAACGGGGGGGGSSGTPRGTYNITVTGTAGAPTHSVSVTLTVQ